MSFFSCSNPLCLPPSQNKIGAGRLMGPKGVAVDKNGHIITVDNKACCVFIFQSNGKLVTKFGGRGTSDRQFAGEREALTCDNRPLFNTDSKPMSSRGYYIYYFWNLSPV